MVVLSITPFPFRLIHHVRFVRMQSVVAARTNTDQVAILKGKFRKVGKLLLVMHNDGLFQLAVPLAYLALIVISCQDRRAFLSPLFAFVEGIIVVCVGHRFTPSKRQGHIAPALSSTL